jgi:hypothetical protein
MVDTVPLGVSHFVTFGLYATPWFRKSSYVDLVLVDPERSARVRWKTNFEDFDACVTTLRS